MLPAALVSLALLSGGLAELPPVPADHVRLVLVRHGQAYSNLDPEPDLPPEQLDRLTDLGKQQSAGVLAVLTEAPPIAILSSPAGRARETASEIGGPLGIEPGVEPRLRPLELGRGADGTPLDWDIRFEAWGRGEDPRPEGGESLEDVGQRVLELARSLARDHAGERVLAIAHSEVIAAFLGGLDAIPGAQRLKIRISNASLSVVDVAPEGAPQVLLTSWKPPTD